MQIESRKGEKMRQLEKLAMLQPIVNVAGTAQAASSVGHGAMALVKLLRRKLLTMPKVDPKLIQNIATAGKIGVGMKGF